MYVSYWWISIITVCVIIISASKRYKFRKARELFEDSLAKIKKIDGQISAFEKQTNAYRDIVEFVLTDLRTVIFIASSEKSPKTAEAITALVKRMSSDIKAQKTDFKHTIDKNRSPT